jgi:hypothetical protein
MQPVTPTQQGLTKDKWAARARLVSVGAWLVRDRGKRDNPEQSKNGECPPRLCRPRQYHAIRMNIDHIGRDRISRPVP